MVQGADCASTQGTLYGIPQVHACQAELMSALCSVQCGHAVELTWEVAAAAGWEAAQGAGCHSITMDIDSLKHVPNTIAHLRDQAMAAATIVERLAAGAGMHSAKAPTSRLTSEAGAAAGLAGDCAAALAAVGNRQEAAAGLVAGGEACCQVAAARWTAELQSNESYENNTAT